MDISMDIHEKSVDMDMDMNVKYQIHGNPEDILVYSSIVFLKNYFTFSGRHIGLLDGDRLCPDDAIL